MSIFNWFSSKSSTKQPIETERSDLGQVNAAIPSPTSDRHVAKTPISPAGAGIRKSERLEKRELLYAVVRESMITIGLLSSKYKFKILSLDSRGFKYLITMDISRQHALAPEQLAEIEGLIAENAKARHNIVVTAVYWRVSEHVTSAMTQAPRPKILPTPVSTTTASEPQAPPVSKPLFEPVMPNEIEAFRQALSAVPAGQKLASPGEIVRSGSRPVTPTTSFADTEMMDIAQIPPSGAKHGESS